MFITRSHFITFSMFYLAYGAVRMRAAKISDVAKI